MFGNSDGLTSIDPAKANPGLPQIPTAFQLSLRFDSSSSRVYQVNSRIRALPSLVLFWWYLGVWDHDEAAWSVYGLQGYLESYK